MHSFLKNDAGKAKPGQGSGAAHGHVGWQSNVIVPQEQSELACTPHTHSCSRGLFVHSACASFVGTAPELSGAHSRLEGPRAPQKPSIQGREPRRGQPTADCWKLRVTTCVTMRVKSVAGPSSETQRGPSGSGLGSCGLQHQHQQQVLLLHTHNMHLCTHLSVHASRAARRQVSVSNDEGAAPRSKGSRLLHTLHQAKPKNPSAIICNAAGRKNMRTRSKALLHLPSHTQRLRHFKERYS